MARAISRASMLPVSEKEDCGVRLTIGPAPGLLGPDARPCHAGLGGGCIKAMYSLQSASVRSCSTLM